MSVLEDKLKKRRVVLVQKILQVCRVLIDAEDHSDIDFTKLEY